MICVKQIRLCLTFCVFDAVYTIHTIFVQTSFFFNEKSSFCFMYEAFLSFYRILEVHGMYGLFPNFKILCKIFFLFHVWSFFIFLPHIQNFQIVLSVCIHIFFWMFLFWILHLKFTVRTVSFQTLIFYVKTLFCFMYEAFLSFYSIPNFQLVLSICVRIFFWMFFFWLLQAMFTVCMISFQTSTFHVKFGFCFM